MKSILQKIVFSFIVVLVVTVSAYAQVPQGFNFQAVARGATGDILAEQALGVQVSIIKGTEEGNPVYEEAHTVTTNPLGLIQIVIGEGTPGEGQVFSEIDFSNDNYYVKLAIDPAGGTEYEDLGTTRLLSVPYALVAQKAVEGGTGSGGEILEYNLNTANADSSFVINLEGDKQAKPFQVFSKSTSDNRAIWGEAISEASNEGAQRGVSGFANGAGTGSHMGVFGGAVNFDATGETRRGVHGQAASKAKFNYGVFGIAAGDGNGETETNPEEGDFGSFNLGGYFQAFGNLNGNTGAQGVSAGENGSLRNFGLIGTARTTASGINVGVRGEAFNSTTENIAFGGSAFGSTKNIGMVLDVNGGTSNTGMIVNADTAAILNGHSVINGDLTVNGTINGGMGSGSANGQTLDSLFLSTQPESEFQRNTAFYPGFIRNTDQDGNFVSLSRRALQYGDTDSEGTGFIYNWFNKGSMQVSNPDYLNGERASGMSGGYFYMDIAQNDNFYAPLQFGISNAADGGRSFLNLSSLAMKEAGKGDLFSVNIVNDPDGNDPTGETAEMFLWGDESPNFQIGGQPWDNGDHGFFAIYGDTPDGNGWYFQNANLSVVSDGTDEWVNLGISNTNIAEQTSQETILLDGQTGNITISGDLNVAGSINGGTSGSQNFIDVKNSSDLTVASLYAEGENNELGGGLFLSGPNSANVRIGGQNWLNSDMPYLQFFGTTPDGNGFYKDNFFAGVNSNGTDESGAIYLKRTNISTADSEQTVEIDGGSGNINVSGSVNAAAGFNSNNRINILGNLNDTGAGGLEVLDANGALRIYADGGNGVLSVTRASDGGNIVSMDENGSGSGRLFMYNGSGNEALNFDAGSNTFQFKDDAGNTTVNIDAAFGNAVFNGTVTESSDLRLKTNIKTLSNALDKTIALRGVSYNWKDSNKSQNDQIGVIAQEVEKIYPEFVRTDEDGMKSVNYSQMVAVLIEAVKELNLELKDLKNDNIALQAQLDKQLQLEKRLARIEQLLDSDSAKNTGLPIGDKE